MAGRDVRVGGTTTRALRVADQLLGATTRSSTTETSIRWWSATAAPSGPRRRRATSTSAPTPSTTTLRGRPARPATLTDVDLSLADELWASVATASSELRELLTVRTAIVDYDDDPFGVQYWVMRWQCES